MGTMLCFERLHGHNAMFACRDNTIRSIDNTIIRVVTFISRKSQFVRVSVSITKFSVVIW